MSLDKLIAAATDYFLTGADVHRASLAATADLQKAHADYEKRVAESATKKIASKTTKTPAVEQTGDDLLAKAKVAEDTAAAARAARAAANAADAAADAAAARAAANAARAADTAAAEAMRQAKLNALEDAESDAYYKAKAAAHKADLDAQEAAEYEEHARDKEAKARAAAEGRDDYLGPQADDLDVISYEEDIRPLIRTKSLANRDALVALLGKFNVKSGQELTADQYPAFLAGLKAI